MNATLLPPPALSRAAQTLPVRRTSSGLLIGPVLLGEPEERRLHDILTTGGAERIPGYNGALLVRRQSTGQTDLIAQASRLLSTHCGPTWEYTSAAGAAHLLVAIQQAPPHELGSAVTVSYISSGLLIGTQVVPVNTTLTGRLTRLTRDLLDPHSPPLDARWYGTFDVSTCGSEALVDVGAQGFIVQRDQLARALDHCLRAGARS